MNTEDDDRQRDLIDEITRYLATVELFRSLSCEPHWRPEVVRPEPASITSPTGGLVRRAH